MAAKANLGRMLEQNHHIRTSEEGDRWEEYDEHQAILESELRALQLALKDKKEATKVNSEMRERCAKNKITIARFARPLFRDVANNFELSSLLGCC